MGRSLDSPSGENDLGATPIDDISGLIPEFITTRKELFDAEFANINKAARKYLVRVPSTKIAPLSAEWLYDLHKEMFGDVWDWAGQKRRTNKSIGIDKSEIEVELRKLIDDYSFWTRSRMGSQRVAVRLHHRLVQIHPFENGNGRWARMVANIYLRQNNERMIQWPEEELYIKSTFREEYVDALRDADEQNYQPLMEMHRRLSQA